jgi:hypothetical protein
MQGSRRHSKPALRNRNPQQGPKAWLSVADDLQTPARTGMISELDIYRAANLLIDRHGGDALIEAATMVDGMLELGDPEGRQVWRRIKTAIEQLQAARYPAPTSASIRHGPQAFDLASGDLKLSDSQIFRRCGDPVSQPLSR